MSKKVKQIAVTHSTERKEFRVTINGNKVQDFFYGTEGRAENVAEIMAKVCAFDCAANEQYPTEILFNKF